MGEIQITIPEDSQAKVLKVIASNLGYTRNKLIRNIASELSEEIPDSVYKPQKSKQIKITGLSEKTINKISTYTNSINSSPSEELKRKIDSFIRRCPDHLFLK